MPKYTPQGRHFGRKTPDDRKKKIRNHSKVDMSKLVYSNPPKKFESGLSSGMFYFHPRGLKPKRFRLSGVKLAPSDLDADEGALVAVAQGSENKKPGSSLKHCYVLFTVKL